MESTVLVERRDTGIQLIGINRPEANNRIDPPTYVALGQALYELEHDDELRVGVLHALGPDFVPALDLAAYGAAAMARHLPGGQPAHRHRGPAGHDAPAAHQAPGGRRREIGRGNAMRPMLTVALFLERCPSPVSLSRS